MENKKKSNKWIWWVLGIGFLLAVAYYIYKYTSLPKVLSDKLGNNPTYNAGGGLLTDYGDTIDTDKVLMFGDKSNNVTRLQSAINEVIDKYGYSYTKISVDGDFGAKTLAAVKYISNDTLTSGTVTVNKVYNLPKLSNVTAGTSGNVPYTNANPYSPVSVLPDTAFSNPFGGRLTNPNLFSNYKN